MLGPERRRAGIWGWRAIYDGVRRRAGGGGCDFFIGPGQSGRGGEGRGVVLNAGIGVIAFKFNGPTGFFDPYRRFRVVDRGTDAKLKRNGLSRSIDLWHLPFMIANKPKLGFLRVFKDFFIEGFFLGL